MEHVIVIGCSNTGVLLVPLVVTRKSDTHSKIPYAAHGKIPHAVHGIVQNKQTSKARKTSMARHASAGKSSGIALFIEQLTLHT